MTALHHLNDQLAREVDGLLALVRSATYGGGGLSAQDRQHVLDVSVESLEILGSTVGLAELERAVGNLTSLLSSDDASLEAIDAVIDSVESAARWGHPRL